MAQVARYLNSINGSDVPGTEYIENRNPSDLDDVIGLYAAAGKEEVDAAVQAANAALPAWAAFPVQERFNLLERVAAGLLERKKELAELLSREEGKTLAESHAEVLRTSYVFKFFAGEVLRRSGEHIDSVRPGVEVDVSREPVGVIGLITPWNVPVGIPGWKVAPALAHGNCVLLKPSEVTPGTAHLLTSIILGAGVPKGVFNLLMGSGSAVGNAMLESPGIHAISFTGSVATGRHVGVKCFETGKKLQMEMGGKNPLLVLADADLDIAADAAVDGAFFSTGQRCTASSRLIVMESVHDRFVDKVKSRMKALRVGHAFDERTQIGPLADERQFEKTRRYTQVARDEGGRLFGGDPIKSETRGYFAAPVLVTETTNAMRINREEVFGPFASVIKVRDYDEGLQVANDTSYGLSAGICTTSLKHSSHFKRNVQSGVVTVNMSTCGADYHVPFGGRKASSYGSREQGRYAIEFFTTVKTAYTKA